MTAACPPLERLAEIAQLAPTDPRRAHLAECPRCRAQLALYQRFLDPGPVPAGADLADARGRISRSIEREMTRAAAATGGTRPRASFRHVLASLARPAWKPALALGAIALAGIAILNWTGIYPPAGNEEPTYREQGNAGAEVPVLSEPTCEADGSVVLHWTACVGADSYEVILYGTDLQEKARFPVGSALLWRLRPGEIDRAREASFVAVSARSGGDEIGRSNPTVLTFP
jgi:hypothetical protein